MEPCHAMGLTGGANRILGVAVPGLVAACLAVWPVWHRLSETSAATEAFNSVR